LRIAIDARWPARWLPMLPAPNERSAPLSQVLDLHEVLHALQPWRAALRDALGAEPECIASQCWLRCGRPPHHWHQDGALHHDFGAQPQPPPQALLAMCTCWIALTPCGVDAPGIEWLRTPLTRLLGVHELDDSALRARFGREAFVHPAFAAGEGLLFDGALLHRTHITAAMHRPRRSIELRFCAGPAPLRLAAERRLAWPGG